jgi:hypothetical protein
MGEPRVCGHVSKRAVSVVTEKKARGSLPGVIERATVYQKNVEPAVVIVIEESDAATHFFEKKLFVIGSTANIEGATQARLLRNIRERHPEGRLRSSNDGKQRGPATRLDECTP